MQKAGEPIPDTAKRGMSLRSWAVLLVLASLVPLVLFGWIALRAMVQNHSDAVMKSQTDTTRVLAGTVDGEVRTWKAALRALAASRSLQEGPLGEFYEEARQVALQHEGWILLIDATGQQLLNTLRPYGVPLPKTGSPDTIRAIFRDGKPIVTDLAFGSVIQRFAVSVVVPVVRNGQVLYALSMTFSPESLTRLLQNQQLPASWILAIQDSQYHVVTRLPQTEERMGKPVLPWFEAALRSGDHGIATGSAANGIPIRVVFNRLTEAPWSVALAIPLAALPSPRPVYWFIALGLLLGCCAVAGAVYASRMLTRPVTELAARAEGILRGELPEGDPRSGVQEIQALEQALVQAATSVQALHREQARAAVAEERAKAEAAAAAVLRAEVAYRQQAEEALQHAKDELEQRVEARTAELAQSVEALKAEVTRRTLAEEVLWQRSLQLRALAAELTLAEHRERRRLADVLHDDLQQLLVGARLQLNELQRLPDAAVHQTAGDVEGLIKQALEVSRSLTRELNPPILQEGGLVPALKWLGRWMQDRHGLQVQVAETGEPAPVKDDARVLLFQAVRELLFNVVKHAQVSRAYVEVSRLDEQIRIVVRDEGSGFDPAQLQVEGVKMGGFGLFSIRERLELLGGRLEIESTPGKGSRVALLAPLEPVAAEEPPAGAPPIPRAEPEGLAPGLGKRIHILVVDDHVIVRQGLVRLLNAEPDLDVVGEASEGGEAIRLTRQLRPDVVIMDVGMREMNGIEATRAIHAEAPEVRVIGLSMYEEAEKGPAMREAGAVSYVSKLGPSEALLAAIRACVQSAR